MARLIEPAFDADWYLQRYPDVRAAGVDPLAHYLEHGAAELSRQPNPIFFAEWYADQNLGGDHSPNPLVHYMREGRLAGLPFNPVVDPEFVRGTYGLGANDDVLGFLLRDKSVDRISPWFSRVEYLEVHSGTSGDSYPEADMLQSQQLIDRPFSARHRLVDARAPHDPSEQVVASFSFGGERYDVVRRAVTDEIVEQIRGQALIDPDVMAPGGKAIRWLGHHVATGTYAREPLDHRLLLEALPQGFNSIIVLPKLSIGGGERYAAFLAKGLTDAGAGPVLVVTTAAPADADRKMRQNELFDPMRDVPLASIGEWLGKLFDPESVLATLLLRAAPRNLFILSSEVALNAVARHGAALASQMRIATAFFSEPPPEMPPTYSAQYLRSVLSYVTVISDNGAVAKRIRRRVGPSVDHKFLRIPSPMDTEDSSVFTVGLAKRRALGKQPRALWLSRWDPNKATDVLAALAQIRPNLTIDVFGPDTDKVTDALPSNVRLRGLAQLGQLPIDDYDLMLFTSYYEGMPLAILEMAGRGLPIITSDVGGLRETFDDEAVSFVSMDGPVDEIARRFGHALDHLATLTDHEIRERVSRARQQLESGHAYGDFVAALARFDSERPR